VIDQKLDLPRRTVQLSDRQPILMAQGGQPDRFGVDGSDLPGWRPEARAAAMSRVGTRTSRCPAASRSRSSRRVMFRQSSAAKLTCGHCWAQLTRAKCPSLVAGTVFSASRRPTSSRATAVWVRLWESVPIITMYSSPSDHRCRKRPSEAGTPLSSTRQAPGSPASDRLGYAQRPTAATAPTTGKRQALRITQRCS
jgi:hypothetical protein